MVNAKEIEIVQADWKRVIPIAVRALGLRHISYGVQPAHYACVGNALLWTLKQGLGESFDSAHESAWRNVYGVLAETMQSGTSDVPASPTAADRSRV